MSYSFVFIYYAILICKIAPAREAHSYEFVTFDGDFTSKNVYKGTPRPELDRAWSKLLESVLDPFSKNP